MSKTFSVFPFSTFFPHSSSIAYLLKLKLTFSFNITVCKNGRASFKGRKPILSTDCMTFTHLYF